MKNDNYTFPVNQLLSLDRTPLEKKADYSSLNLNQSHIPELMRMVDDEELYNSDVPLFFAPLHAARALGELKAVAAIELLLKRLCKNDNEDNDWIAHLYPDIFQEIGIESIPALANYLNDSHNGLYSRIHVIESLVKIAENYPEQRQNCIEILVKQLNNYNHNDDTFNAFLIGHLAKDLKAIETLELVREVFYENRVDIPIYGDLEDIEIYFGIRTQRDTPTPDYHLNDIDIDAIRKGLDNFTNSSTKNFEKVGRNEPCPCGSGKKYKKCCL